MGFWSKKPVLLLLVLILIPGISNALTIDQKNLVGLKGVCVLVEALRPEVERLGLNRAQIETDVELRLRKAQVRVLTKEESHKTPGNPFLYVHLNVGVGTNICAFSIYVGLNEEVMLKRGFNAFGIIWYKDMAGTVNKTNIRTIRALVGDLIDMFINDYLAANPKR
jgi:hypothetical protein